MLTNTKHLIVDVEDHRRIRREAAERGMSLYKLLKHIIMRYYDPDHEVPTIQEGEPTPVKGPANAKYTKEQRADMDTIINKFMFLYKEHISPTVPYVNRAIVYRNMSGPLQHYSVERLLELLESYIGSDDKYFKAEKWGILTFLSMRTLNKLEQ